MDLFGRTYEELALFDTFNFNISLMSMSMGSEMSTSADGMNYFRCPASRWSNCRFIMSRAFTPILYYIQPRVIYYGSEIGF